MADKWLAIFLGGQNPLALARSRQDVRILTLHFAVMQATVSLPPQVFTIL
jgi:hypothetical protein